MRTEHLRVDVLGGMDESWRAPPTSAELIENMTIDSQGVWREIGGYASIFYHSGGTDPFVADSVRGIESLFWWSKYSGGHQYLVWEQHYGGTTCDLVYFNGASRSIETIEADRQRDFTPGPKTQYLAINGWMYFTNGLDGLRRWNGPRRRVANVGFARRPTGITVGLVQEIDGFSAVMDSIGGNDVSSSPRGLGVVDGAGEPFVYGYAFTVLNDLGMESPRSDIAFVEDASGSANFAIVTLPELPGNAVAIRLWRTKNIYSLGPIDSAPLYLHSEFPYGSRISYVDGYLDTYLGPVYDETKSGTVPSGCRLLAAFKGCLFLAGSAAYQDRVFYSYPGFIEQFPETNFFDIGGRDSGPVTAMVSTKNSLVVFRERGIFLIKGDPVSGFVAQTLTEDIGCTSARGVAELPGGLLAFVSRSGIYALRGALENVGSATEVVKIGQQIQRTFDERVSRAGLSNAILSVHKRDKELWAAVPTGGGARLDLILRYHYEWDSWSLSSYEGGVVSINGIVETSDHRSNLFVGRTVDSIGEDPAQGTVCVYSHGYTEGLAGSSRDTAIYRSAWIDFGSAWERTHLYNLFPYLIAHNTAVSMVHRSDRSSSVSAQAESRSQRSSEHESPLSWGGSTWDAESAWASPGPVVVSIPVSASAPLEWQWELEFESRAGIVSYDVSINREGPARGIIKLDSALNVGER